jgi:hypothetical protein
MLAPRPAPKLEDTTPCRLSVTTYSIYSQLPSIFGGCSSIHNLKTCHAVVTGTHLSRPCIYIYEILVHMKMSLNWFKTNSLIYSYNTRKKSDLPVTGQNSKLFKKSFAHNGVLIFNKVSSEIKNTDSITKFKNARCISVVICCVGVVFCVLTNDKLMVHVSWLLFVCGNCV